MELGDIVTLLAYRYVHNGGPIDLGCLKHDPAFVLLAAEQILGPNLELGLHRAGYFGDLPRLPSRVLELCGDVANRLVQAG